MDLKKLVETAQSNVGFLLVSVFVVAVLIAAAYGTEKLIEKKTGKSTKSSQFKVTRMTLIGVFSAIAIILMLFDFPIWFAPSFYKIDFSEIPVVIGTLALGPVAGMIIELIKIVLNLLFNGTTSAFVGEFANFLFGCAYIIPVSVIYFEKKTKKHAIIGLIVGTITATICGGLLNAYLLLPKYAQIFGMDLNSMVEFGTKVNSSITSLSTFIFYAVTPFNLLKYGIVSVITILIYKHISHLIKVSA